MFFFIFAANVCVIFIKILHILRSSCLKFQARRSVPDFSRNEPLPVQDPGQARINSVQKKKRREEHCYENMFTQLAGVF